MHIHTNLRRKLLLSFSLLALSALVQISAGCGSSSPEHTLTKQEFIRRADRICARVPSTVVANGTAYRKKNPGVREDEVITEVALPTFEKELQQIKALGLPDEVSVFVRAFESGITDLKEDPLDGLVAETNPFMKAREAADAYGLNACSAYP